MSNEYTATVNKIRSEVDADSRIVFVSGYFNVLHPGHLRLLYYAASQGDKLVVGLIAKSTTRPSSTLPNEDRLTALSAISCVDQVVVLEYGLEPFLKELKPNIVVMGSEHRGQENPEEAILSGYGGRVIFSSGESTVAAVDSLESDKSSSSSSTIEMPMAYLDRHHFDLARLRTLVSRLSDLKLWVIGDTIIDEYVACDAVGMSQEDPTIVVRPVKSDIFLGGAGIVAGHAKGFGAQVAFTTVTGDDDLASFTQERLTEMKVDGNMFRDPARRTTHKKRYRAEGKTMLRLNNYTEHSIGLETRNKILAEFEARAPELDAMIFSDFNYGILPQTLVESIIEIANRHNVLIAADSQTSSQVGDISRFAGATLLTPTEREARVGVQNSEAGLVAVAETLRKKTNAEHIFVTLGGDGMLIHTLDVPEGSDEDWNNDRLPAMNTAPRDPAGAGDALLVTSTLALAAGAAVWEAAYIGSIAAACQVGRIGNIPLTADEVIKQLEY